MLRRNPIFIFIATAFIAFYFLILILLQSRNILSLDVIGIVLSPMQTLQGFQAWMIVSTCIGLSILSAYLVWKYAFQFRKYFLTLYVVDILMWCMIINAYLNDHKVFPV